MFGIKMPWTKRREAREQRERDYAEAVARAISLHNEIFNREKAKREQERRMRNAQVVNAHLECANRDSMNHFVSQWNSQAVSPQDHPLHGCGGTYDGGGASGDWDSPRSFCGSSSSSSSSSDSSSSSSDSSSSCSGSD